jgi:hypothetical protein
MQACGDLPTGRTASSPNSGAAVTPAGFLGGHRMHSALSNFYPRDLKRIPFSLGG